MCTIHCSPHVSLHNALHTCTVAQLDQLVDEYCNHKCYGWHSGRCALLAASWTTTGGGGASGLSLNTNPSWDTIHYHFDSSVYSILFDTTTTPFFIPVVLWLNHLLSSCMMHNTVLSNHSRTIGVHCRFCVYNKMLCCNGDYSYRNMTNERMSKYKPKWSASYSTLLRPKYIVCCLNVNLSLKQGHTSLHKTLLQVSKVEGFYCIASLGNGVYILLEAPVIGIVH